MEFLADLHVHSRFSRSTSKELRLVSLHEAACRKGIRVLGTGDFTHPGWREEIERELEPLGNGLLRLRPEAARGAAARLPASCRSEVGFILTVEISGIYRKNGKVRKVHNLIVCPSLEEAGRITERLARIGNLASDGRPILGLDSRDLLEIVIEPGRGSYLVPAHIWTPWFSLLGSHSGFDSPEECFGDLAGEVFAVETGLSSDPPMNWRLSALDRFTLVSSSDAHSAARVGREATVFRGEPSFDGIRDALRTGAPELYGGTVEFFPEEGKYHMDGHRACGVRMSPAETNRAKGICPACGKMLTVGVLHRVEQLADRDEPPARHPFASLIPFDEVLGECLDTGAASRKVEQARHALVSALGPEIRILKDVALADIERRGGPLLAEAIGRMRRGDVKAEAGFDGIYGVIRLFDATEKAAVRGQGIMIAAEKADYVAESASGLEVAESASGLEVAESASGLEAAESAGRLTGAERAGPLDTAASAASTAPPGAEIEPPRGAAEARPAGSPAQLCLFQEDAFHLHWSKLNQEQREAVLGREPQVCVTAGPGTGKTRTLTLRAAYLVRAAGVSPERVLAVTFTNRAAREMRERLDALVDPSQVERLHISTIHAFGASLLRDIGERLDPPLTPDFRILTEEELDLFAAAAGIDVGGGGGRKAGGRRRADIAGRGANDRLTRALLEANAVSYDGLVELPLHVLSGDANLLRATSRRFEAILVDEFQDLSPEQYDLIALLASAGSTLFVIGDPQQAVYGFRGADARVYKRFKKAFRQARFVTLGRNYRSTDALLRASDLVLPKPACLVPAIPGGSAVFSHAALDPESEAAFVASTIEARLGGTSHVAMERLRIGFGDEAAGGLSDFAVLYRTHAQAAVVEEALARAGLPCQVIGARDPDRALARRLMLAFVELACAPSSALHAAILAEACKRTPAGELLASAERLAKKAPGAAAILREGARLLTHEEIPGTEDAAAELMAIAAAGGDRPVELSRLARLHTADDLYEPRCERITLSTLHGAKGLEFNVVFMVGCEAGLLPHAAARAPEEIEEERRLFYVGMTRARHELYLTRSQKRRRGGTPSASAPSPFLAALARVMVARFPDGARGRRRPRQLGLFGDRGKPR